MLGEIHDELEEMDDSRFVDSREPGAGETYNDERKRVQKLVKEL